MALALAVATDPEVLILDDPTLGLDTVVRRDFLESLIQIIQRRGRTILFSSHILGDVERVADRIGILVDGVLRVDCPTDHFKDSLRKVILEFDGQPPELLLPSPVSGEGPRADGASPRRVPGWSTPGRSATSWSWCWSVSTRSIGSCSIRSIPAGWR